MLDVKKIANGRELTFVLGGRLDTTTAPGFEAELKASIDGVEKLVFDIAKLEYVSSAGLRVLLSAQKIMNRQGVLIVKNPTGDVYEIFEVTGTLGILTIE